MLFFSEVPDPQPVAESPPAIVVKAVPDPQPIAARAVAAPTFRGIVLHAGHDCPACGYELQRTPISRFITGGHVHTCPKCAAQWWH